MAVGTNVGVVTDFEMTLTSGLFKISQQNNDFFPILSIPQKKLAMVLSKIQWPGLLGPLVTQIDITFLSASIELYS